MVWTIFTPEQMESVSKQVFMPLILLVNYTLLLYLVKFYWPRRYEHRVRLLFAVAVLGVLCLLPFANPNDDIVDHLNDVSESCCVLTFLSQITIIGHDLNKKMKFRTVMVLTRLAELLMVADLVCVVLSFIDVFADELLPNDTLEVLADVCENVTLVFIFAFRYYYIVVCRGWRDIWSHRKVEVVCYVLFATHEMLFEALEEASGLSWESAPSLWNRVTLSACLIITARGKVSRASKYSANTSAAQQHHARSPAAPGQARRARVHASSAHTSRPPTEDEH